MIPMNPSDNFGIESDFFEKTIRDAMDFSDLYAALHYAKAIECSDKTYSAEELVGLIEETCAGLSEVWDPGQIQKVIIEKIPNDYGIADNVTSFMVERPKPLDPQAKAEKIKQVYARAEHLFQENIGSGHFGECLDDLQECAQEALALDPDFMSHLGTAIVMFVQKDDIKDPNALAEKIYIALSARADKLGLNDK